MRSQVSSLKEKEEKKKRRKFLGQKLVGRLREARPMSGSEWTALQGQAAFTPTWEMLRVLRSDPSPRHKNADTWPREDTRGWGGPR